MASSALLGGTCLVLLAMVQTPWQFYLLLGVGVGAARTGLENIGPRTAIANWFVRRRAAAFAWSSGGRAVFGFTMVPLFAILIEQTSWRAGWAVLGVVELIVLTPWHGSSSGAGPRTTGCCLTATPRSLSPQATRPRRPPSATPAPRTAGRSTTRSAHEPSGSSSSRSCSPASPQPASSPTWCPTS